MKEVKKFVCDICGHEWDSREMCETCENSHPTLAKITAEYGSERDYYMPNGIWVYGRNRSGAYTKAYYTISFENPVTKWNENEVMESENIIPLPVTDTD